MYSKISSVTKFETFWIALGALVSVICSSLASHGMLSSSSVSEKKENYRLCLEKSMFSSKYWKIRIFKSITGLRVKNRFFLSKIYSIGLLYICELKKQFVQDLSIINLDLAHLFHLCAPRGAQKWIRIHLEPALL